MEAVTAAALESQTSLKIGIVGFGNFGQFLAKAFVRAGHQVIATSRSDYSSLASFMNVKFYKTNKEFCDAAPDCILLCVSILSFQDSVGSFPWDHDSIQTALIVDVLSVKELPKKVLIDSLPPGMDILCTHPMFGPESGKYTWKGTSCLLMDTFNETYSSLPVIFCVSLSTF